MPTHGQFTPPIIYFFVEGSIGAGKTTLLECLERYAHEIVFVPEPIAAWRNVRGHNVLDRFYAEPARWALAFQTHAMATRVAAVRDAIAAALASREPAACDKPLIVVCERSIYTDRYIFVEMLHAAGTLDDAERALYETAFDYYATHAYPGTHGGVVYLKSDPRACAQRIADRARDEENAMALTYLQDLDAAHDRALASPDGWETSNVLSLDVESLGDVPRDTEAARAVAERVLAFIAESSITG